MANYPVSLHTKLTLLDNVDDVLATHPNTLSDELYEVQTKLGINSSSVNTSFDYFLKNVSGAYRTHTHDGSSDDGANIPVANVTGAEAASNKENTALDTSTSKYPTNRLVKEAVDGKISLTGNESINGVKTFVSSPIVPTPTTDMQASTKKYVDDKVGAISLPTKTSLGIDSGSVSVGADSYATVSFNFTYASVPIIVVTPRAGNVGVGENYWVESVTTTTFRLYSSRDVTTTVNWVAVGTKA